MANTFNDLVNFIDLAEKNRKYPENTAQGLRASLKVFGKELKPDEFNSLNLVEERMDEIFLDVLNSNKDKYSIDSLNTYKMRFIKVIKDYNKYGANPSNMQNWVAKARKAILQKTTKKDTQDTNLDTSYQSSSDNTHNSVENVHKLELALRPKEKFELILPREITKAEAETIKAIIDSLAKK